jgi:hypothetical protein
MSFAVPGTLFAATLCLAGVVAWQTFAPVPDIEELPAQPAIVRPVPVSLPPAYAPPPEGEFAVISARPVFDPARRPVGEPEAAGMQSLAPPDLALVGVAIGSGTSVALLKKTTGGAAISVHLGDAIDGWKLTRIEPGLVVLHAAGTDFTVKMRAAAGLPQPALNTVPPPGVTGQPGP